MGVLSTIDHETSLVIVPLGMLAVGVIASLFLTSTKLRDSVDL